MKTYDVEIIVRIAIEADTQEDAEAQALEYASEEDLGFIATINTVEL